MKNSPAYDKLALIYNHVMQRVRYNDWADYIYSITKDYVNDSARVLELAGGNCNLANHLAKYYPDIIITDYSRHMLLKDKINLLPKVCCDMSLLPFKAKFDLVYSTFDSVNYLTARKKLAGLFREVAGILSDTGIFTFDASLERNSFIHTRQPVREGKFKNVKYVHQTIYDPKKRVHKNIFTITFDDGKIFKEVHKQKIYPFEEYFNLIDKAGLYVTECLEAFTFKDAKANSIRAQFILAKKPKAGE